MTSTTDPYADEKPYDGVGWDELSWWIDNEGFDYFFRQYTTPASFEDEGLKQLAERYRDVAERLKQYIAIRCTDEGAF